MKPLFHTERWVSRLALAAFAVTALSSAAHADHWRRYKDAPGYGPPAEVRHVHYAPQRVVYLERHSDAAPVFAALIGGLVIGSILSQQGAPPAPVEPAYYYWDPWWHERYASLPVYDSHCYYRHHPRVLRVVSVETGECVGSVSWYDGGWRGEHDWDHGGDWDHDGDHDGDRD